tara:strand:- start:1070 stop:1375 length:306 start_codon:yes stop_codon:yes gene_type:complete
MATVGISLNIDVSKIDKTKLVKGEKGTYLNATAFVNLDEKDQYDNNGMITQSTSKEEREAGTQGAILGNSRVFYQDDSNSVSKEKNESTDTIADLKDDIPF